MIITSASQLSNLHELAEKGEKIYQEKYRTAYEARYPGQYVAIDLDSGVAYLGTSLAEAMMRGRSASPDSLFHMMKIGAPAVYRLRYSYAG